MKDLSDTSTGTSLIVSCALLSVASWFHAPDSKHRAAHGIHIADRNTGLKIRSCFYTPSKKESCHRFALHPSNTDTLALRSSKDPAMSTPTAKSRILSAVQATIGHHCDATERLWEAFQASGTAFDVTGQRVPLDGNKRLAVVGDAVLKLALMDDWYRSGRDRALTASIMLEVATNENLDRVGKAFGLDRFVHLGGTGGTVVNWRTMAATVEAVPGAVWYDGGLDAVKSVMRALSLVPTPMH